MITRRDFIKVAILTPVAVQLHAGEGSRGGDGPMKEALYYLRLGGNKGVSCQLCPRACVIAAGDLGFCRARKNVNGRLVALGYGAPCAVHVDPVEKKPFFHVAPKTLSYSIASAGCNLRCRFCQNWQISQVSPLETANESLPPERVVDKARERGCRSIAYTYTEPTNFYEYMLDTAKAAKARGVLNVSHSNGYINEEPLKALCTYMDAVNIDLKGFSAAFYRKVCEAELEPVLNTIATLKRSGVWVEITNLLIPGHNDDSAMIADMCRWVVKEAGADVPVHFSRFFPMYKMTGVQPTPVSTLERARDVALKAGLKYAYIGNVPGHAGRAYLLPCLQKASYQTVGLQHPRDPSQERPVPLLRHKGKRHMGLVMVAMALWTLLLPLGPALAAGQEQDVRKAAFAGSFYPSDPLVLSRAIDTLLKETEGKAPKVGGHIFGIIVPHAGYQYSGKVAAYAYNTIRGKGFSTVILLGGSHRVPFKGVAVYPGGFWESPLGRTPINEALAGKVLNACPFARVYPPAFQMEHSLEVQLPFLQKTLKDFSVVPIVMGQLDAKDHEDLAQTLAEIVKKDRTKTLIVASSDMSHFHSYAAASRMDKETLEQIRTLNGGKLLAGIGKGEYELCGSQAVLTLMIAARELGGQATILNYANSGDVTSDKTRVVGYCSVAFSGAPTTGEGLNAGEQAQLLAMARKTLEAAVHKAPLSPPEKTAGRISEQRGVFVTLTKKGDLRGCIGYIAPIAPLYKAVPEMTVAAATKDPRFPPVAKAELKDIHVEISVLGPLVQITDPRNIEVGKHGLYIVKGRHAGLLLPQVATSYGWDREEFLNQTCHKAGLPAKAWHEKETQIYTFTAQIFSE